jgi:hypothetical protein
LFWLRAAGTPIERELRALRQTQTHPDIGDGHYAVPFLSDTLALNDAGPVASCRQNGLPTVPLLQQTHQPNA